MITSENVTSPISVLIVDDEPLARSLVRRLLDDEPEFKVVGESRNGAAAVVDVQRLDPDVILLDVEMPLLDGIATVRELSEVGHLPYVVFVTAHSRHAIEAFELNALDYVVKPIEKDRLAATLSRIKKVLRKDRAVELTAKLIEAVKSIDE